YQKHSPESQSSSGTLEGWQCVSSLLAGSISITLRLTFHAVTRKWFYNSPFIFVLAAPMSASMLTVTSIGKLMVW
ncbi:hypothetical protein OAU61_01665, partial [Planktomarina temperata]|nr:hypothetical protein [Planktomarina temperata]